MDVSIIPFHKKYAGRFRDLNLAWLKAYFKVEEKDRELLEQCEIHIIKPGGHIFFATLNGKAVGCFALIKLSEGVYELGKMAVDLEFQGKSIGQQMLAFAIAFAREQQWEKIILYSSTRLHPALHLYRKYGFREVALEVPSPYVRSDIKMELNVKTQEK